MLDFSLSSPVSVSLATAMLLWNILIVTQIPNGATVRSSRLQRENIRVEKLTVDAGRPVKEAAAELTNSYGFRQVRCNDPLKAPLGSVLVYGGRGAGHIEFRTRTGFVSDFSTTSPSRRPLIGVFVKP